MKKIVLLVSSFFCLSSCADLQTIMNNTQQGGALSSLDISNGLKQALEIGISQGVELLSQKDGYYGNSLAKILFPEPLQKVDKTLRSIGLGSLADEGVKLLNRAAEDAVTQAKPIFINAVKNLSFSDATAILTGGKNAATEYLKSTTTQSLVQAFSPKIEASLSKVGADQVWNNIITKYNSIPLVTKVEPNLTSYVTEKAIDGLFLQIAQKEEDIRTNISSRTTPLLQKVFAKQ
jgi:hypothetical protein